MVQVAGVGASLGALKASVKRTTFLVVGICVSFVVFYGACLTRVGPNEFGVEQRKFGLTTGIMPTAYSPGLYFVPFGATMYTFPREIHVLDASYDREESLQKAQGDV